MTDKTGTLVMRVLGFASGAPCPATGKYLQEYTPFHETTKGTFTPNINEAKHYADIEALMSDYRTSIGLRPDGKPDRPITAFNIEVIRIISGDSKANAKTDLHDVQEVLPTEEERGSN